MTTPRLITPAEKPENYYVRIVVEDGRYKIVCDFGCELLSEDERIGRPVNELTCEHYS